MYRTLALAAVAVAAVAAPAVAQENLIGLEYFETTSTRTLAPNETVAQYNLSTLEDPTGSTVNQVSLSYGLTNTLMVAGALQAGGHGAPSLQTPSYQVGMLYAPAMGGSAWSPALQLQYQGGFNQTLEARGILSFDAPIVALGNGVTDRFNLSTNLVAAQSFQDLGQLQFNYDVGVSYPLFGTPALETPEGTPLQQIQRWPDSRLRAAVELAGELSPQGSHYVVPGVLLSPSESVQLGLGVGLRLAGEDKPLYLQSQVQLSF